MRTRAAVVAAIKRAADEHAIDIPADGTISLADTPLIITQKPKVKSAKRASHSKSPQRRTGLDIQPPEQADAAQDPEAETPQPGELNEDLSEVPR